MQVVLDLDLAPGPDTRQNAYFFGTSASRLDLTEDFPTVQEENCILGTAYSKSRLILSSIPVTSRFSLTYM